MLSVVVTEVYDDFILVVDIADINHIKNVFRKVKGDRIRAVDGTNEYLCEIEKIEEKEIKLKILEKTEDKFSLDIEIDAGISILKGDKMDLTIQKLTELGINKIIPISVKRCVVKLDKKKDRWDTISKEALKQYPPSAGSLHPARQNSSNAATAARFRGRWVIEITPPANQPTAGWSTWWAPSDHPG